MKSFTRILALLTAMIMLSAFVLAEPAPIPEAEAADKVVATFNGTPMYLKKLQEAYNYYAEQGYTVTYAQILEVLIETQALKQIISENGFDHFTDEELAAYNTQAAESWETAIQSYVTNYLTEDTEEARTLLRAQADQYFRGMGYSPEYIADGLANQEAQTRYLSSLVSEDSITREEVQAYLDKQVEEQKAEIGDSAYMYELYQMYLGREYMFTPAGYRRVLHILMKLDESLKAASDEASEILEGMKPKEATEAAAETTDEPTAEATAEPEAEEEDPCEKLLTIINHMAELGNEHVKAARPKALEVLDRLKAAGDKADEALINEMKAAIEAMAIASKQDTIDEIETRLQNGEEFAKIAPEYNEDPGQDLNEGYKVHPESIMWDPVFRDAAFSPEMNQPGDHSKPVLGSYGVHILYYLDDVPAGAVELTDELYAELAQSLLLDKQYDIAEAAIQAKISSSEIVRETAVINELDSANDDVDIDFNVDDQTAETAGE